MLDFISLSTGYIGLFASSFLAASSLPFSSEVVIIGLQANGYNVWMLLLIGTLGNYLGGMTNYILGRIGERFVLSKYMQIPNKTLERAQERYKTWGNVILFFSWVPVIGDPLILVAGMLKTNIWIASFWIILGKALRYAVLLGLFEMFVGM